MPETATKTREITQHLSRLLPGYFSLTRRSLAVLLLLMTYPALGDAELSIGPDGRNPYRAHAGSSFYISLPVENAGPEKVSLAVVTIDLPPELTLESASSNCETSQPLRCEILDFHSGRRTYIGLRFKTAPKDGTHVIRASVTSADPDPIPENNSTTQTIVVSTAADLYVSIGHYSTLLVDPGEQFNIPISVGDFAADPFEARHITLRITASNADVEELEGDGWSCSTNGPVAECFTVRDQKRGLRLKLRAGSARDGRGLEIAASITSPSPEMDLENNQDTSQLKTFRWIAVDTPKDEGAGSLRAAFESANVLCAAAPCRIVFEIPPPVPAEGWFTIRPATPLPILRASRLIIDGNRQTVFGGDSNPLGPEIFLDGRNVGTGNGIDLAVSRRGGVEGLAIGNFPHFGLHFDGYYDSSSYSEFGSQRYGVRENYLGSDPTGLRAAPNMRGLLIGKRAHQITIEDNVISGNSRAGIWDAGYYNWIEQNRIGVAADDVTPLPNGASGIFMTPESANLHVIGNKISYNAHMGVAISRSAFCTVHANSMRANGGLGIDFGLDGVTPPVSDEGWASPTNPPILSSARFDPLTNRTTVEGRVSSRPLQNYLHNFTVSFYANDSPDGDGETYLASYDAKSGDETFAVELPGDLRGKWINATLTRVAWIVWLRYETDWYEPSNKSTSELCAAVEVF